MKKYILLFLSVLVIPCVVFAQKQIEISNFYAKVYLAPNTTSRFIGLAQKGEVYQVISVNNSWYQIQFKVSMGWVNTADTKIHDPNAKPKEPTDSSGNMAKTDSVTPDSLQRAVASNSSTATPDTAVKKTSSETQSRNQSSQTAQTSESRTGSHASSSSSSKAEDKSPSKIRDWFTKQNPFNIEHTDEIQGETKQVEYYQVVLGPTRVLPYLDPEAPLLGMAKKGDSYELIGKGDSWCKIAYGDSVGWIETKNGKIVDKPDEVVWMNDLLFIGIIIGIILVLVVIIMLIIRIKSKKNDVKGIAVKKNVLFVAKTGKNIQDTFGENSVSLDKCFTEIGFKVKIAKDTNSIFNYLNVAFPDVVMVDWNFDRNAIGIIERTFFNIKRVNEILIIMYNVPDPSSMPPSHVLPQIKFLGISFSDRDIFKLVTPQITDKNTYSVKKSNSSALEGENDGENLLEVLQYIETGRKTGCILVETDKPYGLIYFNMGRINYAATASGIKDKDAVFKILELKQGKFRFVLDKKPKRCTVNLSTLEVLMEWTKTIDEAHGN